MAVTDFGFIERVTSDGDKPLVEITIRPRSCAADVVLFVAKDLASSALRAIAESFLRAAAVAEANEDEHGDRYFNDDPPLDPDL